MRSLVLILTCALVVLACSGKDPQTTPDVGVPAIPPDAAVCDAPCGTACCQLGETCEAATHTCRTCAPDCTGKKCGDDGCGGSCGACVAGKQTCEAGVCKGCATVVCEGVCCAEGQICDATSKKCAACTPDCTGRDCGDNGCGGSCGGCMALQTCQDNHKCAQCAQFPDCGTKVCGADPTGCVCGTCPATEYCTGGGECAVCPRSLCFGACCLEGELCNPDTLACEACQPKCAGKTCGDDGCGGVCGNCKLNETCSAAGACATCASACGTRKCGLDKASCSCGNCAGNDYCVQGLCATCDRPLCNGVCCEVGSKCEPSVGRCQRCTPQCAGKNCGDDGCGGVCGSCDQGQSCTAGQCAACAPQCAGKDCGDDLCGGHCGAAPCDAAKSLYCLADKCAACTPEKDDELCARLNAECGTVITTDNCGAQRALKCGKDCTGRTSCDPVTYKCVTVCVAQSDTEFCAGHGIVCGPASGTDTCNVARYIADCGKCTSGACNAGKCH